MTRAPADHCRVNILDDSVHTADEAAARLGISVGQIANSLIFDADVTPTQSATQAVSTRWAPEVSTSSGLPTS
jgi:prolyl-tRNA editing enzyme YbaK/EbsC (Cys-tRNA(Pro) deacylase)